MSREYFDRDDFAVESEDIKKDLYRAILGAFQTNITPEAFTDLVLQAVGVYGFIVRAQMLEGVSEHLEKGSLNEALIDKTIEFLARRCDRACARLAEMVELIAETKTPGPRH